MARFGAVPTRQICFASNRRPGLYIRPNVLRTTAEELAEKFRQAEINFEITAESMMKIQSPRAVTQLPGFDEGLFSVQDVTASQAVRILAPKQDWTILDLCAAPGGKTAQLAEFTSDKAKIVATDINSRRLEKVKENIIRLGISSVRIVAYEQLEQVGPFDCVLLDVPCSNTGVLARRPEVRYRITPQAIAELAKIQMQLLGTAAKMIKPKAKICYSTCSIQSDENSGLIKEFLQKYHSFNLEAEELILPSAGDFGRDGGYVAVLADIK